VLYEINTINTRVTSGFKFLTDELLTMSEVAQNIIYTTIAAGTIASALVIYGFNKKVRDTKNKLLAESRSIPPNKRLQYFKEQSDGAAINEDPFRVRALRKASEKVLDKREQTEFLRYMYKV
jgi:hypothetical protein